MKRILLLALLSLGALVGCQETRLTVGSYNVRYDAAADATNGDSWAERKEAVAEIILQHDFDIVGTQEANARQLPELESLLGGYGCIYHPYGGNNGTGHNCATFYKLEKFDLLDQGTFWYSPTPEVKSIGWDATDYRLCHWGKFREKQSGKEFYFFNSHLYWRLHEAREKSGGVHISMVKKIAGDSPVISVGDFNSTEGTPQVQEILSLLKDAHRESPVVEGCDVTDLGGGNFQGEAKARIDFIFLSKDIEVESFRTIEDKRENGHYPSDHLPIAGKIRLK
ncbi:MAG: endonuclease/exonuclease/phosphatase family protein [Alistipes sp.]|nr:endonuclease/exonuclease/phosphatase family protein [Alistipes sp.]